MTTLIGILGVVVGVILTEVVRRTNRVETFAHVVFERRLLKYEELIALFDESARIATLVMDSTEMDGGTRMELISSAILPIAEFADANALYIDEDLGIHCVAAFMGAEDVASIKDEAERKSARSDVREMWLEGKRMIQEDSGVRQVNRLLKRVNKPTHASPIVDRIRYLRANPDELKRLRDESLGKR